MLSTSKENGGLLASIGLKKDQANLDESLDEDEQQDPHKKSDLFDTSQDRGNKKDENAKDGKIQGAKGGMKSDEEDFDLGFGSDKKDKKKDLKKE